MGYKSLLFCPDEGTARVVTQVLSELEFAVEPANDPFTAVKKLNDERFDALIVDCQNEQDASLLFKTARDSSQNHSSLSVAVVEGQAGVAKAFRIGANLVLTKPINIEQSKGTLRVARGLLRKNEAKPGAPISQASPRPTYKASTFAERPVQSASAPPEPLRMPDPITVPAKPEVPFSAIEVEADATPETEAAEAAVLESLPELAGTPTRHSQPSISETHAEPIAAGGSGQGAAVAPALEKPAVIELKAAGAPPMVTNEPIVARERFQEPLLSAEVPAFSSLESTRESGGAKKFFVMAVIVLALTAAGYFGWQKLQPIQRLQRMRAAHAQVASETSTPAPAPMATPVQTPDSASIPVTEKPDPQVNVESEISATPAHTAQQKDDLENIEVQELPISRDAKSSTAPKAQPLPLIVKPDTGLKKNTRPAQLAPPPVQVSSINVSDSALNSLATTNTALPQLAPSSVRVSQGVSQGLLLKKVPPAYPPMALQLHKEGIVELLTTINKQGLITNIKVLSGDTMLAKPAVDAVRQWKYRPYLLNGEPVEIQTQITINFKAPR
jgi:TonB family protein